MIGMEIGCYKILDKLGQGGMGVVYKAVDTGLDRIVAMKVLNPDLSSNPELVSRFQAEAKAQANLNHTNLATLYAFMVHQGTAIMVMEFVEGETFSQMIRRRGPIPEREAIPMFMQALLGIGYAHRAGIIHRDIKPSNLMLNKNGIVKVMDFGIAKVVGARGLTRTGAQLGTLAYMSPEQIQNRNVDIRSDIYELGITLYEMLTGHLPFEGDSEFQIMQDQVFKAPPPPRKLYPYIDQGIEAVVLKSVEKDPDSRFQTVEQFGAALQHPESLAQKYEPPVAPEDAATASLMAPAPPVYAPPSAPRAPSMPSVRTVPSPPTVPSAPSAPRVSYPAAASAAPPMAPTVPSPGTPAYAPSGVGPTRVSATIAQTQPPVAAPTVAVPAPAGGQKKWILIGICAVLVLGIGGVAAYQALSPTPGRAPAAAAAAPSTAAPLIPEEANDAPPPTATPQPAPTQPPASSSPKAERPAPKTNPPPSQATSQAQTSATQPVAAAPNGAQLMQRAQLAYSQGRIFEPMNDSALHWAIEARKAGNPGGKAMEDSIIKVYKEHVAQYYKQGNYAGALALVQEMLKFYPQNAALMADQQRIQAAANSSAH